MAFTYGTFPRPLGTRMDSEERAYPAGSLRQSRRYGTALCSDGKVRRVKLGVADSFFTIPAVCTIHGRTVHGIISDLPSSLRLAPDAPDNAGDILCFYPHGVHRNILPEWPATDYSWPAMWTEVTP